MAVTFGVSSRDEAGVLVAEIDDEKVNAMTEAKFEALDALVHSAMAAGQPLVIAGRPGFFSAGLDLGVIKGGTPSEIEALGDAGDRFFETLRTASVPTVAACTGHALAAGAVILMCCDYRIGIVGSHHIGLSEVSAGLPIPESIFAIAERRLAPQYLLRATAFAERWNPEAAVTVGYLDRVVVDDVIGAAIQQAVSLASLPADAFRDTKSTFYARLFAPDVEVVP